MAEHTPKHQPTLSLRGGTTKQTLQGKRNVEPGKKQPVQTETSLRGNGEEARLGNPKQTAEPNANPESKEPRIPTLRFKEFEGEWEETKLSNKIEFIAGYAFKSSKMKNTVSKFQLIKMSNVYKSELQLDRNPSFWDDVNERESKYILREKDILLTLTGTVGKQDYGYSIVILENNKFLLNQRLVCLRYVENRTDSDFINNLIKTSRFFYFFFNESKGGTGNQTNVGIEDLRNIKLNIPSLPEQQKIASFLSAVDKKIQQLTKKKALLEDYKKGVMQQLFSQKIRFKIENEVGELVEAPDWEEKRLGELTYKVGKKNKENIQYPIYSINNQEGFRPQSEQFDGLNSNDRGYDISMYKIVNSETFAYNPARINVGSIGYSYNLNKVIVSSLYVCFKTKGNLEDLYLLSYLDTYTFHKDILRYEEGGVRQYLFYDNFSHIKIPLPSIEEQQKIANYLSAIDTKIEGVNKQIEKTQAFKKGLLQRMFV
ncbi:restriction endonuclease subunit S [Arenibacter latericius]|uniref:restriction endonuclease subunit S n=1 Tax=Arenibacter latericius TaxID=86104 RepID=UPI000684BF28|nr:restriction endonuclease subunit S [Arenibacter latericius]